MPCVVNAKCEGESDIARKKWFFEFIEVSVTCWKLLSNHSKSIKTGFTTFNVEEMSNDYQNSYSIRTNEQKNYGIIQMISMNWIRFVIQAKT